MNLFSFFIANTLTLVRVYFITLSLFFASRLIMILSFSTEGCLGVLDTGMGSAFMLGLRIDTQVIMYGMTVPLLSILISVLLLKLGMKAYVLERFIISTYIFSIIILISLLIGNYFFYSQFKSNFNLLVFEFLKDDTKALISTIWSEYPIVWILLLLSALSVLLFRLLKYLYVDVYSRYNFNIYYKIVYTVIFFIVFTIFMRGSIGTFPLGSRDVIISDNSFINDVATNGILSLKQAISNRSQNEFSVDIDESLRLNNFSNPKDAISDYLDREVLSANESLLFSRTSVDSLLDSNKPNVIFILMESMSSYYLEYHSKEFNLLGSLEDELEDLIVLKNFLPKGPRTIQTIDGLILNNVQRAPLSQSQYSRKTFSTSNIKPFHDKGYHTIFASGSQLGWRNIGKFYKLQYFDEVQGDFTLLKNNTEATKGEWGVYDEFLFDDVYQSFINKPKEEPRMYFVLTTSNHTPYSLPLDYVPYPLKIDSKLESAITKDVTSAKNNFLTYQYSNDKLGEFISKVKNSEYGDNTIIVATGDHTNTEFFNFSDSQIFLKTGVPLLMYVPEKYRDKLNIDESVFGSHKDIFPTLFNMALSDSKYVNSGNNLFGEDVKKAYGVANNGLTVCDNGAIWNDGRVRYYSWIENMELEIETDSAKIESLKEIERNSRAYMSSMTYLIQKELED